MTTQTQFDVSHMTTEELIAWRDQLDEVITQRIWNEKDEPAHKHEWYYIKRTTINTINAGMHRLSDLVHGDEWWDSFRPYIEDFGVIAAWMIDHMSWEERVERGLEDE